MSVIVVPKPQVLFVGTTEGVLNYWETRLKELVRAHKVNSVAAFHELFPGLQTVLKLIVFENRVMDCLPVVELVRHVRAQGYTRRILVCSDDSGARDRQVRVGGPNTIPVEGKLQVPGKIQEVLML